MVSNFRRGAAVRKVGPTYSPRRDRALRAGARLRLAHPLPAQPAHMPSRSLDDVPELLRALWRLNHFVERQSRRMAREIGLTFPQRTLLRLIGRFPGITPGALADYLHLDRGTLSGLLRGLDERGLIERTIDPKDRRRIQTHVTARGAALIRPTEGTIEGAVAAAVGGLPDSTRIETTRGLHALADALAQSAESKSRSVLRSRKRAQP